MRHSYGELELPLGYDPGAMAQQRLGHLAGVPGMTPLALLRLTRTYPSLSAVYAAPEAGLARLIGDVAAAKLRWFLDAPLAMGSPSRPLPVQSTRHPSDLTIQ